MPYLNLVKRNPKTFIFAPESVPVKKYDHEFNKLKERRSF